MISIKTKIRIIAALLVIIVVLIIVCREADKNRSISPRPLEASKPLEMDPNVIERPVSVTQTPVPVAKPAPKPLISAEAYLVGNLETGEVYIEHNSATVFPIASISKLITAMIATHVMDPQTKVTITEPMLEAYGDAGHLVLGESLTVSELLYPLLLESSNDAAEALAQSFGYNSFISSMNSFVKELGMNSTSFRDASGLSSGNISNARDLFSLGRYLYASERPLLDLSRQMRYELASSTEHGGHVFVTINPFPGDPHFIGGKTGRTTEAKESMISLFSYSLGEKTYPLAIIVLRSDFSNREVDTSTLFEQAFAKIAR